MDLGTSDGLPRLQDLGEMALDRDGVEIGQNLAESMTQQPGIGNSVDAFECGIGPNDAEPGVEDNYTDRRLCEQRVEDGQILLARKQTLGQSAVRAVWCFRRPLHPTDSRQSATSSSVHVPAAAGCRD
ncbi:hypothetical protein V5F01_15850 [Streptomyces sp. NRRL B-2790]